MEQTMDSVYQEDERMVLEFPSENAEVHVVARQGEQLRLDDEATLSHVELYLFDDEEVYDLPAETGATLTLQANPEEQ